MIKQILWMYRGRELVTNSHSLVPCSSRSFGSFLFGKAGILRFNRWLQRRETGTQVDKAAALEGFRFPWPFPEKPSRFYNMVSYLTLGTVASVSKLLFVRVANELVVHNKERFMNIWMDRSRPLITISNHRSNIDDPLMWSFITTPEMCRNIDRHRYTLAAHNICFTKPLHTRFFSLGRCVPCVRGEGVYQKGMDFCVDKLNENGWVHMFPEGRVTMEPLRFKWGVGRLVEDTVIPPVILPIWCTNMSSVWPIDPPYYPRFGHRVDIHIGEVLDSKVILDELSVKNGWSVAKRRKFITDVLQTELFKLGEAVGNLTKDDQTNGLLIFKGSDVRHAVLS